MFDGVKVWGIGWKLEESSTCTFNKVFDVLAFMPRGIVHDHKHTFFEMLEKMRLEPFCENLFVHGMLISIRGKKLMGC